MPVTGENPCLRCPPPPSLAHIDSPVYRYEIIYYETCKWYFKLTYCAQDHWTVGNCANFVFACLFFLLKATSSSSGLLSMFKLVLMEHVIICRMVQGQMPQAIKEVLSYYNKFLARSQKLFYIIIFDNKQAGVCYLIH